jgi:hypothetical protein
MVEGNEKLTFPALGLVTGFVSTSTWNGKATPYRKRNMGVFEFAWKNAIDGIFRA